LWQVKALTDSYRQTPNKFTDTPFVKNNSVTNVAFVTLQDQYGVLGESAIGIFGDTLTSYFPDSIFMGAILCGV